MDQNIENLSKILVKTVAQILDPFTPNDQRIEAHKMLDDFRDTSPFCADCGFFLSGQSNSCEVRHFGLQLIEHYIKLHWNEIHPEEKMNIKNRILQILSRDLTIRDNNPVKMAIVKIVVEIIKREWPQQWPTLLQELHELCIMGDVQTEIVLLIFLRLAEDIVQLQNVPDKRRKEIFRGLSLHLKDLFPFFVQTLGSHYEKYYEQKKLSLSQMESVHHCHILHVTLETLSVYMEWITINYIEENLHLLNQLCHMLDDGNLQTYAAKCLLSLVERKGKQDDRIPILKLFEQNEMFKVRSRTGQSDEQFNEFEKYFCKVLVNLGMNLSHLMGIFKEVQEPDTFLQYLNCLLVYTRHPNVIISHCTQSLWSTFLRDKNFYQRPSFVAVIPNLLKFEAEKLFIIGYPSKSNSKASQNSLLEFDSDDDFVSAFVKCRSEVMEVIKLISKSYPELAFTHANAAFRAFYSGQPCPLLSEMQDSHCLDTHSVWDSFVHYLESVFIPIMRNVDSPEVQKLLGDGFELLRITIDFTCEDLYIMSYSLSCTSTLFFFANFSPDILVPLLNKIFSNLVNQVISDERALTKDVLNIRRHSCSLLIKLATSQPKLLVKVYDYLYRSISQLMERPEQLSALEKSALLETLMILSNELNDYDNQLKMLKELMLSVFSIWLSDEMKLVLSSPEQFIAFVGLDKSPDESESMSNNRAQILFCVNSIKTCVKRCKIVTDAKVATEGNFIHPMSKNFNSVLYRNPAAELLIPSFPRIFLLIRTLNSLYDPVIQAKLHPGFLGIKDIGESDKNFILGTFTGNESSPSPRSSAERMKTFIQNTQDSCWQTLGDSSENLGVDFYMMPTLSNYFTECLFYSLQNFPDYTLRIFIRTFLKPFFHRCPVNICDDLVNILSGFCYLMFEKLSSAWRKFREKYGTSATYEDQMTEIEEILEDQLNRLLSREYITFLETLLQSKSMVNSTEAQMDDDTKPQQTSNSGHSKKLSELGLKIVQSEAVRGAIVCSAFDGLHWLDTVTNVHCLAISDLVFKQLFKDNLIQQASEASYLLHNALYGLQALGEHESNQGILLTFCTHLYEKLRPKFPELREFLLSTASCDIQTLDKMESILFKHRNNSAKPSSEKQKKDAFRNVVQNIIGKNIGQYHKTNIVIKNLPPWLLLKKKKRTDLLHDTSEESGLCNLFEV